MLLHLLARVVDVELLAAPSEPQDLLLLEQQHPLPDALILDLRLLLVQIYLLCTALLHQPLVVGLQGPETPSARLNAVTAQVGLLKRPLLRRSWVWHSAF